MKSIVMTYWHQVKMGMHFVHEHPLNATSWQEEENKKLREEDEVIQVRADQCMLGLKTKNRQGNEVPAMKPHVFLHQRPAHGGFACQQMQRRS